MILWESGPREVTGVWDSQVTRGESLKQRLAQPKVFMNSDVLLAVCGSMRVALLLKHAELAGFGSYDGEDEAYLMKYFIPTVRKVLLDAGEEPMAAGSLDVDLVVGLQGRLFDVSGLNQPTRLAEKYYVLGSGMPFAQGALDAGATPERALEVVFNRDIFSSGPIVREDFRW